MRKSILSLVLVLSCALALQCTESSQPNQPQPTPEPPPLVRAPADLTQNETSLLESANKFGLNLFREVARSTEATENIFISPLSVSYALGLCYNGANGDTREAIGSTLQMAGLSVEEMNQAYHDVTEILTWTDPLVEIKIGNSFWSRLGLPIQPDFLDVARDYFDARVEEINFQAPWAADTINAWADRATNGKISKVVEPPFNSDLAAILMNAIYFKGNWMFQFDPDDTQTEPFHLADGTEVDCQMMHWGTDGADSLLEGGLLPPDDNATFYQNEYLEAVSLPYGRGDFRMTIMAPNRSANSTLTVDSLIDRFTLENWNVWLSGFQVDRFTVGLPRFKFHYEVILNEMLKAMGMELAFNCPYADFSNMFPVGPACISKVKQNAFVQVDEEGTEAAAVTTVEIVIVSMPPEFIFNGPFLVVIHEDVSGAILFIGKIADPVWED